MSKRRIATYLFASTALTFSWAGAAPAFAADEPGQVETLIVTANKRAENIQDIPMSVTAVSGDYLEKVGINNANDLARFVPSVAITQSNNNRNTTVYVRGIGTSGSNPGIESSVGIFIDGVYILGAGAIQGNLQDIGTIEVLRGPQGTLYGRNTPVGAININTRAPTQETEGMLTGRAGKYNDYQLAGYVGGGLAPELAGRLSFYVNNRDGYEKNLSTGDDVNNSDQYGFRSRLLWTPTQNIRGNFIAFYSHLKANCCTPEQLAATSPTGIATPGFLAAAAATGHPFRNFNDRDHVVDDDYEGDNVTKVYGTSLNFDVDLPGGHTLTSISAFNGYKDKILKLAADGLPQLTAEGAQTLRSEGYSQEFRVASPVAQKFTYLAGLYLFSESLTYTTFLDLGVNANRILPPARAFTPNDVSTYYYTQDTRSWAAFGQTTFNITDVLRVTGGLRYSYDKKKSFVDADVRAGSSAAFAAVQPINHLGRVRRNENKVTWSVNAQYDLTPDVMAYVIAATGYKTGGFNARASAPGIPLEFDAENSETYEAGIKSSLFDRRLVLNIDVYSMKLKDFQDSTLNPLTGVGFIVSNAGDRRVRGVEADAQFRPIDPLTLKGSLSYLDAEFTDYSAGQCYSGAVANGTRPGTCNYNGLTPAQSPEWSWSLSGQWEAPLAGTGLMWFANGDISHTGSKQLDTTLDPRSFQESVTLYGARLGISSDSGNWRVSIYGKNLGDESYFLQKVPQPLSAFISAGGTASANGFAGWYAPPRTYGVEASVKF